MRPNLPAPALVVPTEDDPALATDRAQLARRYQDVRRTTEMLCAPLETEDYVVQSMPDASPAKWHLAHTSWFFETMVLAPEGERAGGPDHSGRYGYLFNSYYNALGERIARSDRGLLSRPTVAEVYRYRGAVDAAMFRFLDTAGDDVLQRVGATIVLGLHHEQQHQELLLTDLKHLFSRNPLRPVYREQEPPDGDGLASRPLAWVDFPAGLHSIGHDAGGFSFDNEGPRHPVYLAAFRLADRLVTVGEYLEFLADGGYRRPELWLSDGWNACTTHHWTAPLYWEESPGGWRMMTLAGMRDLSPNEPVCHVSFYEADAYARWTGARLATEAEWEVVATSASAAQGGNLLETGRLHPAPCPAPSESSSSGAPPLQLFGDVWEWTQSPYTPYPGYRPLPGALGEYNGKFMCNQLVLRGGSCATPGSHIRATYRNFFPPEARWQFSGIRLAHDG
jgi:ergothioneine biosynthesis protein EgtB